MLRRERTIVLRWLFPALSLLSLVLAITALVVSLMHSHGTRGRVVRTELAPEDLPTLSPVEFPLDDFYLMRVEGHEFVALYA